MSAPPVRRSEASVERRGAPALHHRAWLPAEPRRAVALVHGFAEHAGRYEAFASWFAERGHAVHAVDLRGHGRSEGERGHVERFEDYLDDAEHLLEAVRRAHPDLPLVLVGHSMGGLIATALLRERRPVLHAAVTSGAALAAHETAPAWQLALLRGLRRVAPRARIPAPFKPEGLSRDPEVVRRYEEDPLVFRKLTASLALALHGAAGRTAGRGAGVRVPVLVMHGADDPICPATASRHFHASLSVPGSELRIYPGLRHEIFNEPEAESVFEDILDWLDDRDARPGPGPGPAPERRGPDADRQP